MYEAYFGMERSPFKITPDTSLFYGGGKRGDILDALVYAVQRGEGIVKVVGEVGSGKTMLCRMLQLKMPSSVEIIYIANPSVSAQDILFVIAHELGLSVEKNASKHEVMHLLQDYLLQRHMEDRQVVLLVEEAQGMPLETLEEIRLLSNLETDQHKLLQIILFGQPELDENLAQQSIRQLRERITHNFNLSPLTRDEIHRYLNFRMREVGYTGPELIDISLAKNVEQYSGGLVRRINIIADKVLLSAFAESTHNLNSKHVIAAVDDSSFGKGVKKPANKALWVLLFTVIAAIIGGYTTRLMWGPVILGATMFTAEESETPGSMLEAELTAAVGAQVEQQAPVLVLDTEVKQQENLLENVSEQALPVDIQPESGVAIEKEKVEVPNEVQQNNVIETLPLSEAVEIKQLVSSSPPPAGRAKNDAEWLHDRLLQSREWLGNADMGATTIQVLVRKASAVGALVTYLRNDWPLDPQQTYLYEVETDTQNIYRVFYGEFESLVIGKVELQRLPQSVKINSPYLQSIYIVKRELL
ncbi:MAG: AAA family ATPase [Gammaproteobacteria bacterium]|nr:AAA family ATPase [Gammaproteobacteria bacterium]